MKSRVVVLRPILNTNIDIYMMDFGGDNILIRGITHFKGKNLNV